MDDWATFFARIGPQLRQMEQLRLVKYESYMRRRKISLRLAAVLTPVTGWIDYYLFFVLPSSSDDSGFGVTFMMMGALYAWATVPKRAYMKAYKREIMPEIAALFGLRFDPEGKIPMDEMRQSRIVPAHSTYTSEDYFEGVYKGAKLRFSEICLRKKQGSGKNSRYVTVFDGLAVMIDLGAQARFYGHTIITADMPGFHEWAKEKSSGLARADMVDPLFEKKYSVFTSDQVEARYLVHPAMIERIERLRHANIRGGIAIAYRKKNILMLIPMNKNLFEPADISVAATDMESLRIMHRDLSETLALVDYFEFYKAGAPPALAEGTAAAVPPPV